MSKTILLFTWPITDDVMKSYAIFDWLKQQINHDPGARIVSVTSIERANEMVVYLIRNKGVEHW